ncbi:probable amidase At4g34880 [Solanum pennellii]|uniref:Probable amidase At4g34880 n=1 Tax=Solanum pennellii TaxID=28526 RepID=A0ABM1UVJ1_SOLPN|nr:probable amidase At4g34880 [Solanum pennellii]
MNVYSLSALLTLTAISLFGWPYIDTCHAFSIKEASISDLQLAFIQNQLTSRQLVEFYLGEISRLNPVLKSVIEINPDALLEADRADRERNDAKESASSLSMLHGVPILLKDNIATKDKLNTTAGSFSLLGSVVPRDADVVKKLRRAGVIVLGKASLSEWAHTRALKAPNGWSPRGGQGRNPYVLSADPCGSSSGSAISVAANMVSVSLGTETRGSILCPASSNAVVGIKPTVGLTSRAGVIPITPRQDTVGPIGRTVTDAVHVLDAIVGFDHNDAAATAAAAKFIPRGGYTRFLKVDGLNGKRIGIVRDPFFNFTNNPALAQAFEKHLQTLRLQGAVLVDNVKIAKLETILDFNLSGEASAVLAEFKIALNVYLKELIDSPVRSLSDIIIFNQKNPQLEMLKEFGQDIFLAAESTNGIGETEIKALRNLSRLTRNGFVKLMIKYKLDALVTGGSSVAAVLSIGGFPAISVPAAYDKRVPIGICFSGLKGSEPKLIEIAYGFEQATLIRKPPTFLP